MVDDMQLFVLTFLFLFHRRSRFAPFFVYADVLSSYGSVWAFFRPRPAFWTAFCLRFSEEEHAVRARPSAHAGTEPLIPAAALQRKKRSGHPGTFEPPLSCPCRPFSTFMEMVVRLVPAALGRS